MPDPDRRDTLLRRLKTIPLLFALAAVTLLLLPVVLPLALAIDVVRSVLRGTPFMALRIIAFGLVYLAAEVVGVLAAFVARLTSPSATRLVERVHRLQTAWASVLLAAVESIFRLDLRAEGVEQVSPGPILVFSRHTSLVDNLLPARYVTREAGIDLRYVLKRELLSDPALDVAGNMVPNAFVDRTGDSDSSLAAIRRLAIDLGPTDGVLLYPEGTRFTPGKLHRAMGALERRRPRLHELARGFRSVLPPRTGGVFALLDSCRADVVVLAHRGLDGFARVADIWRGAMVGRRIDVRLWRIPRDQVPDDRAARTEWLFGVWAEIDEWVLSPSTS